MSSVTGAASTGRFSEFMLKGALTEPEDAAEGSVYDEAPPGAPAGAISVQQGQPVPEGRELTSEIPGAAASNVVDVDKPQIWPLVENENVSGPPLVKPDGAVVNWDGSSPIHITIPQQLSIRSLYFMTVPLHPISIMSGSQTGTAIYANIQPTGNIAIPDGNSTITLVSSGKFPAPIAILASHEAYGPTQNESISIALASATINVSGTVNANITNASIPVTGNVNANITNASIAVTGSVSATITNASIAVTGTVAISGTVNANITNATLNVGGSVNATITNASLTIAGSVSISSGTVTATISGTPNINISGQSITVQQISTSQYPVGATPFSGTSSGRWSGAGPMLATISPAAASVVGAHLYISMLSWAGLERQQLTGSVQIGYMDASSTFHSLVIVPLVGTDRTLPFTVAMESFNAIPAGALNLAVSVALDDTPAGTLLYTVDVAGYMV